MARSSSPARAGAGWPRATSPGARATSPGRSQPVGNREGHVKPRAQECCFSSQHVTNINSSSPLPSRSYHFIHADNAPKPVSWRLQQSPRRTRTYLSAAARALQVAAALAAEHARMADLERQHMEAMEAARQAAQDAQRQVRRRPWRAHERATSTARVCAYLYLPSRIHALTRLALTQPTPTRHAAPLPPPPPPPSHEARPTMIFAPIANTQVESQLAARAALEAERVAEYESAMAALKAQVEAAQAEAAANRLALETMGQQLEASRGREQDLSGELGLMQVGEGWGRGSVCVWLGVGLGVWVGGWGGGGVCVCVCVCVWVCV